MSQERFFITGARWCLTVFMALAWASVHSDVSVSDQGVTFPDGTMQTTAAVPGNAATVSGHGYLLVGDSIHNMELTGPACESGTELMVTDVYAAPNFAFDVSNIGLWGVEVGLYQRYTSAAIKMPLNLVGSGPAHLSAHIPAGQPSGNGQTIYVSIRMFDGPATHRTQFFIHMTTLCGVANRASS